MVNGTLPLDPTTLKVAAETVAATGEAFTEAAKQVVTSENVQSVFSGILQTLSDNTPDIVSETWKAVAGENPYVAAGVVAATGIALVASGLFMCRRAPAKASKADESKNTSDAAPAPASSSSSLPVSSEPSTSNAANDGIGAEGQLGERRTPSPTLRRSRSGSESE